MEYTVKLKDQNNNMKVFNEYEFSTLKECKEWAKGKAFGLKYTVEIYRGEKLHKTYTEK